MELSFPLVADYIRKGTRRRSGLPLAKVRFIVAHDTGNPSSTARNNVDYYKRSANEESASAQLFVDDKQAIECIPALLAKPEKAWQVHYGRTLDNIRYGDDANDCAIGVERCFGGKINDTKSYDNYVELLAYICFKFGLDPEKDIISHAELDPSRRSDPVMSFKMDKDPTSTTLGQLIKDVKERLGDDEVQALKIVIGNEVFKGFIKDGESYVALRGITNNLAPDAKINPDIANGKVFIVKKEKVIE